MPGRKIPVKKSEFQNSELKSLIPVFRRPSPISGGQNPFRYASLCSRGLNYNEDTEMNQEG